VLDRAAPSVQLITETNVAHPENVSYFGQGDEAQFVYNFTLPPLVMHALLTGSAAALSRWSAGLSLPAGRVTFLNFLASHDGIGVNPVRDILAQSEIDGLVQAAISHGGRVSYKDNPGGEPIPYELNVSYFDALSDPQAGEPLALQVERFMAAQAILLAMKGLPAVYVHSLLGSRNWQAGVEQTQRNRTINRQKFQLDEIKAELADDASLRSQVYRRFAALLRARRTRPSFDPYAEQQTLATGEAVFGLRRGGGPGAEPVVCLTNVSARRQSQRLETEWFGRGSGYFDLIAAEPVSVSQAGAIELSPYQSLWLLKGR
jgi:glucosylglycerate phosphorylase